MPITTLPPAPSRANPSTFSALADAFLAALATFATEANALQVDVNYKQVTASAAAVKASLASAAAALSEDIALAAANYKGAWSSLSGAATVPYCVSHNNAYWMLITNIANIADKVPGVATELCSIGGD